ncbi:ATP-binding protein [Tsukamurella sp. 8F]|uniref:ATP-binding protein n=1 Tax=unclassified Tsukamurella TaxID=2633480 RepID=UPI0023B91678|nr:MULTISPECIES: ATP-binding protein [unclassified Tsukamurella]MDF0532102.1 ATP-binding protein [Tsukamurella sp. 8J]MDF0589220.1 ATP-binding protein [Tsukamurella sp. 8F]
MPHATGAVPAQPIDLCLPAEVVLLPVLRVVPETVALLADFDIDRVSDLTLAVDQVCTELIHDAVEGGTLNVRVLPRPAALVITASAETRTDGAPDRNGFGWRVLETLTDQLEVTHSGLPGGHVRSEVVFTLLRGAG